MFLQVSYRTYLLIVTRWSKLHKTFFKFFENKKTEQLSSVRFIILRQLKLFQRKFSMHLFDQRLIC